jgi:hypothetical protein
MVERSVVDAWMAGYIRAWNTNDPEDIGKLFSEEAEYYTDPFAKPWRGREAIVKGWLGRKDEPGSFNFRYEILAISELLGVVRGWTKYLDPPSEYSNIWVVQLDEESRCTRFTEWWMKRKEA